MNDLNYVLVTGKLTRDPELKMVTADAGLCQFPIAINKYYKKKADGTYVTDTSFFFVESWGELADNCAKYLNKGRIIRVIGHLRQARWTDKSERPHERTYIVAEHIEFGTQNHNQVASIQESESEKKMDSDIAKSQDINEKDKQIALESDLPEDEKN